MTADRGDGHSVNRLLGAYALGALAADESGRVAGHLRWCAHCSADYAELADAVSLLALISEDDLLE